MKKVQTNKPLKTLAARINHLLEQREWSLADLIRNGGPSRPTLFRILNDPRYQPEAYTVERLAKAFRVNKPWMASGDGEWTAAPAEGSGAFPPSAPARLGETIRTARRQAALSTGQVVGKIRKAYAPAYPLNARILARIEAGAEAPPEAMLVHLSSVLHLSLRDLLLASAGEAPRPAEAVHAHPLEAAALADVIEGVDAALAQAGRALTVRQRAELYARFYPERLLRGPAAKQGIQDLLTWLLESPQPF